MAIEERSGGLDHLESVIEGVIGGVAREMTSGEPSGALRATVLRRVSSGDRRGTGVRPWTIAAVAVAGLVIAVLIWPAAGPAVVGPGDTHDRHAARVVPPAARPSTIPGEIEPPVAARDVPPGQRIAANRNAGVRRVLAGGDGGTARQVLADGVSDDRDRGDTVRIAPLEMPPIAVALLQPSAVDIEAVPAPATVVIGEIEVAPLRLGETQDRLVE